MFPDAAIYDEPNRIFGVYNKSDDFDWDGKAFQSDGTPEWARSLVNTCDIALVCVPTPAKDGKLDTSIVEEVVDWLETPLILIKSALQPGTVDRLVEKTGKRIAVSTELIGEGNYSIPYWKYPHPTDPRLHQVLIVGGEDETARRCADVLWSKLSPDIDIHLTTAVEAELVKLWENFWGAMKVTMANEVYEICERYGANYTRVLQAWGSDGRVEKMHCRVMPGKFGWDSKCYNKDIPALLNAGETVGYKSKLIKAVISANKDHLQKNKGR